MSLTIEQVFAQAGKEEMAHVFDTPIHYVVLNRKDNTWTLDLIN